MSANRSFQAGMAVRSQLVSSEAAALVSEGRGMEALTRTIDEVGGLDEYMWIVLIYMARDMKVSRGAKR